MSQKHNRKFPISHKTDCVSPKVQLHYQMFQAQKMMAEAARASGMATAPIVVPNTNRLRPPRPGQNKEVQKSKTSNLEAFKEELRM